MPSDPKISLKINVKDQIYNFEFILKIISSNKQKNGQDRPMDQSKRSKNPIRQADRDTD